MTRSTNIEDYHQLWEDKRYFLAPVHPLEKTSTRYANLEYIPWRKHAISYMKIILPAELGTEIIRRMLESACEVLDEQPNLVEYGRLESLWTDRKNEFVLTRSLDPTLLKIYHPLYKEWVSLRIDSERYNVIIKNMIDAGVPIWDYA
jgi:hypothetical protein